MSSTSVSNPWLQACILIGIAMTVSASELPGPPAAESDATINLNGFSMLTILTNTSGMTTVSASSLPSEGFMMSFSLSEDMMTCMMPAYSDITMVDTLDWGCSTCYTWLSPYQFCMSSREDLVIHITPSNAGDVVCGNLQLWVLEAPQELIDLGLTPDGNGLTCWSMS